MNSIQAIMQLEDLKRDRLSFINNNELDEIYLKDIKAINLAVKALKNAQIYKIILSNVECVEKN